MYGLPEGQIGNSETGNINIGAGRIVCQEITKINKSIEDGDFFSISEFNTAIENCKKNKSKLHIIGLVSDGGVHSHTRHLYALLELAKRKGFEDVYIHCILDGIDSSPASGETYILELQKKIEEKGVGKIASIMGRYYAMDREKNWDRIQKSYDALINGEGEKSISPISAIEKFYQQEIFDEFVKPTVITDSEGKPTGVIGQNDSVIFFNFRSDRAKELTRAIVDNEFKEFEKKLINLYFVSFTDFDEEIPNINVAFKKEILNKTLGEYISKKGLNQLRIAEEEKYSNVTYLFNCYNKKSYNNQDNIIIPSKKVETYDLKPEMSSIEITDAVIEAINEKKYDCIIVNYANVDIVGHTGNFEATIKAIEVVDSCIERIVKAINSVNGVLLFTSDHGNVEQMIDYKTGDPYTAHTTNQVPFIIVGLDNIELKNGNLADVAPTILSIMGIEKPKEMTGESLIINK